MPILGLTGNLASGKSTVLKLLKSKGAVVFDVDEEIYRYYRDKNSLVYKKITAVFPQCLKHGVISRKELAAGVFSSKPELKKLEKIVHPVVTKDLLKWLKAGNRKRVHIAEVPLLFEKKLARHFDKIILITVTRPILIQRIIKKYGFNKRETLDRLSLYKPIREKIKGSDFVIDNSMNFRRLKKEVDLLWKKISQN